MGVMGSRRALLGLPGLPSPSLDLNFLTGSMPAGLTFTRASTAWAYNSSGVLASFATDAPRLDHDPATLARRGLLVEEARTNLCLRSAEFDNASWTKTNVAVTADATLAPDGNASADAVMEAAATGTHETLQNIAAASGSTYTFSIHYKPIGGRWLMLHMNSSYSFCHFGPNGEVGASGGTVSPSAVSCASVGGGWYRASITIAAGVAVATMRCRFKEADNGASSYAGDAAKGFYLWGAQLEVGAFATSHVPTTTASATRAADACSMPVGSWYNAVEGTLSVEARMSGTVSVPRLASLSDGTTTNLIELFNGTATTWGLNVVTSSAVQATLSSTVTVADTVNRIAGAYRANDFAACVNGGTVGTDTSGTVPTVTTLHVGNRTGLDRPLSGHIRAVRYFPLRLPNILLPRA